MNASDERGHSLVLQCALIQFTWKYELIIPVVNGILEKPVIVARWWWVDVRLEKHDLMDEQIFALWLLPGQACVSFSEQIYTIVSSPLTS